MLALALKHSFIVHQARCSLEAAKRLYSATSASSSAIVDVKDDKQFKQILSQLSESGQLGIIDWTAKWCGPCRAIAPVYEKLSARYPEVKFLKVDIDTPSLQAVVAEHMITGVPTFMFYKGSKRVESFSGARADMLEDLLKKHTAAST